VDAFRVVVEEGNKVCAEINGEVVGQVTVCDIEFQWSRGVYVGMGGIAGVMTNPKYRRRGIAKACMERANKLILEKGYSCGGVSTNSGNVARRLYTRSGYVHLFFIDSYWKNPRKRREKKMDGLTIRPYRDGDEAEAVKLFEETYGGYFGPKRKREEEWLRLRAQTLKSDPESMVFAEFEGKPVGYAGYFVKWRHVTAGELIVAPGKFRVAFAEALLRSLENHLASKGLKDVSIWGASSDYEISRLLICNGYVRRGSRVFMLNILRLPALLKDLAPLFERRIKASNLEWRGAITLEYPSQAATLTVTADGEVSVSEGRAGDSTQPSSIKVEASREALTRILSGVLPVWEAYVQGMLNVKPPLNEESRRILDTLFPTVPYFHPVDDWW